MNYTRKAWRKQITVLALGWVGALVAGSLAGPEVVRRGNEARREPPPGVVLEVPGPLRRPRWRRRRPWWQEADWEAGIRSLGRQLPGVLLRSSFLWLLWQGGEKQASAWLLAGAVGAGLVEALGAMVPRWRSQGWYRLLVHAGEGLYWGSGVGLLLGGEGSSGEVLGGVAGGGGAGSSRVSFRPTTAGQRRLLFATWEATGNVAAACRKAHVGRSTFYYWKPRFEAGGYPALDQPRSAAPQRTRRTPPEVEAQVVAMRQEHPDWGKQRIADELAKGNNWVVVVHPNTVRRILREAGRWEVPAPPAARGKTEGRTADQPEQTVNGDLCFVPAEHVGEAKLPAVSGSSGKLVVEREKAAEERSWPGQVFAEEGPDYEEAMQAFVQATQEREAERKKEPGSAAEDGSDPRQERRALRVEEEKLRGQRREIREQRRQEERAWKKLRQRRKQEVGAYEALGKAERKAQRRTQQARDERWREQFQQRRETLAQRRQEDAQWREQRQSLRERQGQVPRVRTWIAVLVVIDNCSRQCLGLPLFTTGSHVTAEEVVTALRECLPPELQFLITDRGVHFTGEDLAKLASEKEFLHVRIARHRPQSNGIAERFVRTFKEWLRDKTWESEEELGAWVDQFREEYNDRPHQGLPLPGLSPNEFAQRVWVL